MTVGHGAEACTRALLLLLLLLCESAIANHTYVYTLAEGTNRLPAVPLLTWPAGQLLEPNRTSEHFLSNIRRLCMHFKAKINNCRKSVAQWIMLTQLQAPPTNPRESMHRQTLQHMTAAPQKHNVKAFRKSGEICSMSSTHPHNPHCCMWG